MASSAAIASAPSHTPSDSELLGQRLRERLRKLRHDEGLVYEPERSRVDCFLSSSVTVFPPYCAAVTSMVTISWMCILSIVKQV